MKPSHSKRPQGFTLLETVIAIGVLSVLLTGFIVVFTPAAQGIRKSINVQDADRLASALEQELVTHRTGDGYSTGFDKAFNWIRTSDKAASAVLVYQYRGELGGTTRDDGTPKPVAAKDLKGKVPGKDYVVVPMARSRGDAKSAGYFNEDLDALEGGVYLVKCTQLVFSAAGATPGLIVGKAGEIKDPKGVVDSTFTTSDTYPEAVIAFAAEFHTLPAKTDSFFKSGFNAAFTKAKTPVFTRNLAVRR
ncbi:MAG: type II secretion system protein [Luteolibacter sp.]